MSRVNQARVLTVLLGIGVLGQILMLIWPAPPASADFVHDHVQQMVDKLRLTGLDLRVVSQREDGLWDNAVYLTKTDKNELELKKLPADAHFLNLWQGTIIVMRCGNQARYDSQLDAWGDACLVNGEFVFFGDKELLKEIRRCMEQG